MGGEGKRGQESQQWSVNGVDGEGKKRGNERGRAEEEKEGCEWRASDGGRKERGKDKEMMKGKI